MLVSINQPAYLPWLGYFHRIAVSDVHVVLDHVQFEKNSFTNRNKVRTKDGWCWLTVPLKTKGKFGELAIDAIEIADDDKWARRHWDTIRFGYAKAPYFREHAPFFEATYARAWDRLAPLLDEITGYLLRAFRIETKIVKSSAMDPQGTKDELVVDLCRKCGATTYLSGALGRAYIREELFERAGIALRYQDYAHPTYTQVHGGEFQPYMAALDLLFNHGPASRDVLLAGQAPVR